MEIKVDEISKILRQQIEGFDRQMDLAEVGTIISVGDGIARIYGLEKAMSGELLELAPRRHGNGAQPRRGQRGRGLFGESDLIKEGDQVRRTRRIMQVPAGEGSSGAS
jgi:F-type H+-transporting ATPase subunit alpha